MKRNIKFIYIGLLSFFIAGFYSCNEFEEFESIPASSPSTIEVVAGNIGDSTLTVNVTNSSSGYAMAGLAEAGSVDTDDVDADAFVGGNVEGFTFGKAETTADESVSIPFSGLTHNTEYTIVVVATNEDGVSTEPETITVTTGDSYVPELTGSDPSVGLSPTLPKNGELVLNFNEPVVYDETKAIEYYFYLQDVTVSDFDVTVDGAQVTLVPGTEPDNMEYVFLNLEEGVFTDLSGQPMEAITSGLDEGYPFGWYYRVVEGLFEAEATPASGSPIFTLDFTSFDLTFEQAIGGVFDEEGAQISVTVNWFNGDTFTKVVSDDMIAADGMVATIQLPDVIDQFVESVSVSVDEGFFSLGYGSPNGEMAFEWSLNPWLGTYNVEAVSYANPGEWDEAWTGVSVSPSEDGEDLVHISGIGGGSSAVEATIDRENLTITINSGSLVGDPYEQGSTGLYLGDANLDYTEKDIIGSISENGNINQIDFMALVLLEGENADTVWDVFNTHWMK